MRRLALTCLMVFAPLTAQGQQTFRQLPNGQVGFDMTYSTVGLLVCDPFGVGLLGGTCTGGGNHLTLTSGSAILDLIYHPVTLNQITATTTFTQIPMGAFEAVLSGSGPFTFPTQAHGFRPPILAFFLTLMDENDVRLGSVGWGYINDRTPSLPRNCCSDYASEIDMPIFGAPAPYDDFGQLVFHNFSHPTIDPDDMMVDINATVAIVPEPASLLLVVTGLAIGAAILMRRRTLV